ncbi:Uncharacterised protein [Mycobacteroides abscessus subsp. abscessus]|nr:Uncharacterised protein [Mycobacteroides abscessus subsp. abscessus]
MIWVALQQRDFVTALDELACDRAPHGAGPSDGDLHRAPPWSSSASSPGGCAAMAIASAARPETAET